MKKLTAKEYNRLVAQACSESNLQVGRPDRQSASDILKAKLKAKLKQAVPVCGPFHASCYCD